MHPIFEKLGVEVPLLCGPMYPCSNPELVAAVSEAGGLGVIQPLSLIYVWGYDFREGIKKIRSLTQKPFGMNALIEKSSAVYEKRLLKWVEISLEEGCRFFVTSLGNPKEIVRLVKAQGGVVFHDVTERKWAEKAIAAGVDGLICVNNRAGGHAGTHAPGKLFHDLKDLNVPLICAGGIGDGKQFADVLRLGYIGAQLGTRFIATKECRSPESYKEAITKAHASDIVLTERVTGIPLAVIRTPYVDKIGLKANLLTRFLLRHRRTKYWMRFYYQLQSVWKLKRSMHRAPSTKDYWQAGQSVDAIEKIESVAEIMAGFKKSFRNFSVG